LISILLAMKKKHTKFLCIFISLLGIFLSSCAIKSGTYKEAKVLAQERTDKVFELNTSLLTVLESLSKEATIRDVNIREFKYIQQTNSNFISCLTTLGDYITEVNHWEVTGTPPKGIEHKDKVVSFCLLLIELQLEGFEHNGNYIGYNNNIGNYQFIATP